MSKHFLFQRHNTMVQIHALTTFAWEWLKENVYYQYDQVFDKTIAVYKEDFGAIFIKIKKEFQS